MAKTGRKFCKKCNAHKTLDNFYQCKNGLWSYCKECSKKMVRANAKKRRKLYPEKVKATANAYRKAHLERAKELAKEYHERRRLKILTHYGGNPPKCYCCGETEMKFLGIDHLNGGGLAHLRIIGRGSLPAWLVKNKFPKGFGVLCHNCNFAKGHYGHCPHKEVTNENTFNK